MDITDISVQLSMAKETLH